MKNILQMKKFNEEEVEELRIYQEDLMVAQTRLNAYAGFLREKYEAKENEAVSYRGLIKKDELRSNSDELETKSDTK